MAEKSVVTKIVGLVIAVVLIIAGCMMPETELFPHAAWQVIGLILAMAVLWITSPIPLGATALIMLVLLYLLGLQESLSKAASGFANVAVFFAIAIFCIPAALTKTSYGARLLGWIVKRVHGSSKRLVFLFMVAAGILSMVLSDFTVTIIFYSFALTALKAAGAHPAKSNLGKCLMIGIPVAAILGGMCTPVGGGFNVLALTTMEGITGTTISFIQWMAIGLPIAIVMLPVCWFSLTHVFKPEALDDACMNALKEQAGAGELSAFDKKAGVIFVLTIIAWIASSFVNGLDATTVTIVALVVMMLPGINIISFKEFKDGVPWDVVLIIGSMISVGLVFISSGAAAGVAGLISASGITGWSIIPMCIVVFGAIYLLHTFFPIGFAIITIFVPILVPIFVQMGISPVAPTVAIACIVAGNFLLPFNPTVALTFGEGYYSAGDMFKFGIIPAIILIVLMALWFPFISGII